MSYLSGGASGGGEYPDTGGRKKEDNNRERGAVDERDTRSYGSSDSFTEKQISKDDERVGGGGCGGNCGVLQHACGVCCLCMLSMHVHVVCVVCVCCLCMYVWCLFCLYAVFEVIVYLSTAELVFSLIHLYFLSGVS
eukprot:GHVQ01024169.1.p1 GENE.GHVQ01024169.1~~GHVQ01024169.1.p1  ORF type:complete len:137 (-),score=33.05 GHVQ01024169.1:48-458(-)